MPLKSKSPVAKPRRKPGRPAKEAQSTVEQHGQALAQYGVPFENIAAVIDLSVDTMKKLYGPYLEKGKALANAAVGERLFKKCQEGDTTAMIFWAKTQMGWRETQKIEHSGTVANVQMSSEDCERMALDAAARLAEIRQQRRSLEGIGNQ